MTISHGIGMYANTFEGDLARRSHQETPTLKQYLLIHKLALPTKGSQADWTEERLAIAERNALELLKG